MGVHLEFSPQRTIDRKAENAGAYHRVGRGISGGGGGVVKADHQHTVIALVKNTGKAHNIVGDPPKETGISGEQGAVNVAAVSVHILYDDLVGSAGEKSTGRSGSLQRHFPCHRRIAGVDGTCLVPAGQRSHAFNVTKNVKFHA